MRGGAAQQQITTLCIVPFGEGGGRACADDAAGDYDDRRSEKCGCDDGQQGVMATVMTMVLVDGVLCWCVHTWFVVLHTMRGVLASMSPDRLC